MTTTPNPDTQPAPDPPYTIDEFNNDTAGWRCHNCNAYAGPYGTTHTAQTNADHHQTKQHPKKGPTT